MNDLSSQEFRALMRRDFCSFLQRSFHELMPRAKFWPNWHIEHIAGKLEACRQGRIKRLIINVPPRSLKSLADDTSASSGAVSGDLLPHE